MTRLLVLGATGAVGRAVVARALADPRFAIVTAPTRRALPPHDRLANPLIELTAATGAEPFWPADAVISALGTTQKQAGGRAAFHRIDHDLVLESARHARAGGAAALGFVSSVGASAASPSFYLRTKGAVEAGLRALTYPSLTIVRPSMIDAGRRERPRPGEELGAAVFRLLAPVIPRRYRAVTPDAIAAALIEAVLAARPGAAVVESEAIARA
ncbi:NAD(P)H-binding protein [Zavarzinia compransoris]|uniref:NAD-dependent dehydratase n=1 Tax=Zavarzinia compransoris TaxID=1264899 RepID=A0A317E045_9PROT|nr:NAD(P)H-binding protein [Zavarzinia compransoris]PWR20012.1 NAD-dependent dehydratase [Zavarzinia compransoris]TDP44868.1 uncharacterized protein YbjT (DUF2867 family) [Zavarzinia compransoris]